jgi:hypothetical protein
VLPEGRESGGRAGWGAARGAEESAGSDGFKPKRFTIPLPPCRFVQWLFIIFTLSAPFVKNYLECGDDGNLKLDDEMRNQMYGLKGEFKEKLQSNGMEKEILRCSPRWDVVEGVFSPAFLVAIGILVLWAIFTQVDGRSRPITASDQRLANWYIINAVFSTCLAAARGPAEGGEVGRGEDLGGIEGVWREGGREVGREREDKIKIININDKSIAKKKIYLTKKISLVCMISSDQKQ